MTEVVNKRLYEFNSSGAMGVVKDTTYRQCFWPVLDEPTEIFSPGSSGIRVEGPPTPRNVVFPMDTVFLNGTRGDCFFFREQVEVDV